MGVVATGQIVEKEAQLPGCAFGRTLGASQPRAGKRVEALADRGQETKVVSPGLNLPQKGTSLGGSQHMEEGVLREAQPTDRAAPIIVHGAERRPCPSELVE